MRSAFVHEDDYCQVELVCAENLEWCLAEIRAISEFSEVHRDGESWTAMYERTELPVKLAVRGLTPPEIAEAVTPYLPPFDEVQTGYSTFREEMPHTTAFGLDDGVLLFAEQPEDVVCAVWFTLAPRDESDIAATVAALTALARWQLLLVDWSWKRVLPLDDAEAITAYLRERMDTIRDIHERMQRERQQREASWPGRLRRWFTS